MTMPKGPTKLIQFDNVCTTLYGWLLQFKVDIVFAHLDCNTGVLQGKVFMHLLFVESYDRAP